MKKILAIILVIALIIIGYSIFSNVKEKKSEENIGFGVFPGRPYPGHYDFVLAEEKGLVKDGILTDEYYDLQLAYVNMIWTWLDEKTGIRQIDQSMDLQKEKMIPLQDMASWYRKNYSGGNEYFFLRTTPFIERLSMDEFAELKSPDISDERVIDFIDRTLLKAVRIDESFEDNAHFGYESWGVFGPNAGLLLGFAVRGGLDEYWIQYAKNLSEQMSRQTGITIEITTKYI